MARKCSPEMQAHIEVLGLDSVNAYEEWCRRNKFAPTLTKNTKQRRKEQRFYKQNRDTWDYIRQNEYVDTMDEGRHAPKEHYTPVEVAIIYAYKAEMKNRKIKAVPLPRIADPNKIYSYDHRDTVAEAFAESRAPEELMRLLLCVAQKTEKSGLLLDTGSYVKKVAKLADYYEEWLRNPQEMNWVPKARSNRTKKKRVFLALVRHLLAKYRVPGFIESAAWLANHKAAQRWYIDIGSGKNIRKSIGLPVRLTKKEAHYFLTAPDWYTPDEAIRFAQIHAFGGSPRLANTFRETKIVANYHPFWLDVLRFFVKHIEKEKESIEYHDVSPICDYLYYQKFEMQTVSQVRGTVVEMGPRKPKLSMRGRSPRKLLTAVNRWHKQLRRDSETLRIGPWPASNIPGGIFRERNRRGKVIRSWDITEILSGEALVVEGAAMNHCVAIYAKGCLAGQMAIYSMGLEQEGVHKKVLTIEVSLEKARWVPPKTIRQIRGKHNRYPNDDEMEVIKLWAEKYGLKVPNSYY